MKVIENARSMSERQRIYPMDHAVSALYVAAHDSRGAAGDASRLAFNAQPAVSERAGLFQRT